MMSWEKVKAVAAVASVGATLAIAVPVASLAGDGRQEAASVAVSAPAPAVVTGKVSAVNPSSGGRTSYGIFVTGLSGPVKFGAKATCKAKGWTSTVTFIYLGGVVLKPVAGAAVGDVVTITM